MIEEITASFLMRQSAIGMGIALAIVFLGLIFVGIGTNYLKQKHFDFDFFGMCVAAVGGCATALCFVVFIIALLWRILGWMLS